MRRLSPPAAGLILGLLTGLADAAFVILEPGGVSATALAAVVWTWATIGCLTGVVFGSRWRGIALMAAGPALLLLARATIPFKGASGWSTSKVLLAWGAVSLLLCAAGALARFRDSARRGRWAIAALVSLALLLVSAADPDVPRASARHSNVTPGAPHNVVLIVLDTARYDDTMAAAPHIAAFARSAVSFDNAWTPAAWTVPSHFAMFTGRDPWTVPFDADANRYQYGGTWLAGHFRARGYATGAVFSNNRLTEHEGYGRDFDELTYSRQSGVCRSGIGYLLGYSNRHTQRQPPLCERMDASEVAERARSFMRRARRPYFLALNFIDPHDPYLVLCRDFPYATNWERRAVTLATPRRPAKPATVARVREQYRAAIGCMDRAVGALLRELDDGRTVIAIVADHGEQFGEHGLGGHGTSVYREVLHVPLIVKAPSLAPARVADAVSTTDLYLSLIRAARGASMPLLDPRQRRPAVAQFDLAGNGVGAYSVARGNLHFIRFRDGRELLFDFARDPNESRPLPVTAESAPLRDLVLQARRQEQRRVEFEALGYLR
jgi:arylsulfatase A-like enzyme